VLEVFNQFTDSSEDCIEGTLTNEATTLPDLFEQQVQRTPEATALMFGQDKVTYRELDARANQLARHLISLGIGPEQIVALALPRSIEMVVALLAVLKSGAAYLPLDPDYPAARLAFMITDSQANMVITAGDIIDEAIFDATRIRHADNTDIAILDLGDEQTQVALAQFDHAPIAQAERLASLTDQNLAYLIYTSGSTGRPKGSSVTHSGLVNLTRWYIDQIDLDTQSVGLLISAIGFDLTQKNIFSAFTVGASLRLPHRKTSEIDAIIELIIEDKTSWLNCTPSAFSLVLDAAYGSKTGIDSINSINYLVLGGEPIESAKLERWLQETSCHVQVLNSYGPTEC
jgi:non-ribosomal peptide synthetase component F